MSVVGQTRSLCGFARTPLEIGIALGILGLFASIYHPVRLSLLVADPAKLGRTLGINGVFGNLSIAGAAMTTGLPCDVLGWRWAFIAPGLLSMLAGIAFLIPVPTLPKAGAKATEQAKSTSVQSFTVEMAAALLLFIVCDSLVFNATTIALPKVAETHMSRWFESPAAVGTSDAWRSRAYAISYVVAFGVGPAAVPLIAALYDGVNGFPYLFAALAAIAGGALLAALTLRLQMRT
jgi:hypothetical protein